MNQQDVVNVPITISFYLLRARIEKKHQVQGVFESKIIEMIASGSWFISPTKAVMQTNKRINFD
jgi:hypothetical protein